MSHDPSTKADESQGFLTESWDKVKQSLSDLGEGMSNFGQRLGRSLQGEGIHTNFEKVQDALGESWTTVHDSFKPIKTVAEDSVTSLHHFAVDELPRSVVSATFDVEELLIRDFLFRRTPTTSCLKEELLSRRSPRRAGAGVESPSVCSLLQELKLFLLELAALTDFLRPLGMLFLLTSSMTFSFCV
mmetsp:Transcript_20462/g.68336  ORF Transcript_20462/g.68336 Transcript_20462/m.68336 type:complete len:187 (-) Transcript_20462:2501-3061(-)